MIFDLAAVVADTAAGDAQAYDSTVPSLRGCELLGLFGRLGYRFAPEQIPKTIDYGGRSTSNAEVVCNVFFPHTPSRSDRASLQMTIFAKRGVERPCWKADSADNVVD